LSAGEASDPGRFDLVVSADPLARALRDSVALARVGRLIPDGGALVLAAMAPGSFADVVLGLASADSSRPDAAASPIALPRPSRAGGMRRPCSSSSRRRAPRVTVRLT